MIESGDGGGDGVYQGVTEIGREGVVDSGDGGGN